MDYPTEKKVSEKMPSFLLCRLFWKEWGECFFSSHDYL